MDELEDELRKLNTEEKMKLYAEYCFGFIVWRWNSSKQVEYLQMLDYLGSLWEMSEEIQQEIHQLVASSFEKYKEENGLDDDEQWTRH